MLVGAILRTTLGVTALLMLIFMSSRFIGYLADAAAGELAADVLLQIMLYRIPGFFELLLPLGFFVGVLLALGQFYADSEMVVLQACGMSVSRLLGYCLIPAVFLSGLVALIVFYITPHSEIRVHEVLRDPKSQTGLHMLVPGRFQSFGKDRIVTYAEVIDQERDALKKVFVAQQVQGTDSLRMVIADNARIINDANTGMRY